VGRLRCRVPLDALAIVTLKVLPAEIAHDLGVCEYKCATGTSPESMQFGCCSPIVSGCRGSNAIRPEEADVLIQKTAKGSEVCRRLDAIPGIEPLPAAALIASIRTGATFRKG